MKRGKRGDSGEWRVRWGTITRGRESVCSPKRERRENNGVLEVMGGAEPEFAEGRRKRFDTIRKRLLKRGKILKGA